MSESRWPDNAHLIKWLSLDVDGVLTDGRLYYDATGEALKAFHVRDGQALKLWHQQGMQSLVISGRESAIARLRAQELGIKHLFFGVDNKAAKIRAFCQQTDTAPETIAHIGDDLPDLSLMAIVGLGIGVADSHEDVRARADFVTNAKGGTGAIAEVVRTILDVQGRWQGTLQDMMLE